MPNIGGTPLFCSPTAEPIPTPEPEMFFPSDAPRIEDDQTLETHARDFIEAFSHRTGRPFQSRLKIEIRPPANRHAEDEDAAIRPPVVIRMPNNEPVLYLRADNLLGQPASVMEGGLAMELAGMVLQQQPDNFRLNFEREILPLFDTAGSAVQFLRRLVMHLETGLKRFKAAQLAIDAGYGAYLFYYFYHTLQPSDEDRRHYTHLTPHRWMRAMYLAQKNSVHMPLTLIDEMGTASGMREFWQSCHGYLMPEDVALLVELAEIPGRLADRSFAKQVAAMFKKIMVKLLI